MKTNTILIALGTGACRIACDTRLKEENDRLRIFYIDREEGAMRSLSDALLSDVPFSDKRIILFSTLGGHTGSRHILQLAEWFAEKGIACQAVFSAPFLWEGKIKMERALEVLSAMERHGYPMFIFCNDLMSKCDDVSLDEAFRWRDKEMATVIGQLLAGADVGKEKKVRHLFRTRSLDVRQMYKALIRQEILLKKEKEICESFIRKSAGDRLKEAFYKAAHNLGMAYREGKEVEQDFTKSLSLLMLAAEEGYVGDERLIAEMYEEGMGTVPDKEKALEWYLRAATQGDSVGQFNVGYHYETLGDYATAVEWYRKAGRQGNVDALCNLGDMYEEGVKIPQDHLKALKCFRRAAQDRIVYAQYKLGCFYENGKGIEKDNLQAFQWYSK